MKILEDLTLWLGMLVVLTAAARVACRALVERYPQTYLAEPLKRFRKAV